MKHIFALGLAIALAATASSSIAKEHAHGPLKIENPHARVTIAGRPAAGYMKIHNASNKADALVSASSPMAERVELHTHLMENGIMKMRPVQKVEVPANGAVTFGSGDFHLMIFGPKSDVKPGKELPITLTFASAASVTVDFAVTGIGATAPAKGHAGQHHKH